MYKRIFIAIFLAGCTLTAFAQGKPRLGILPFAGGSGGDGETIANLFSIEREIQGAFEVVPRTRAVDALVAEQNFQMAGYTDSDTIARIGGMLNADFVVSGHIRSLGNRNLIIINIVNVETFEQLAGDYRTYRTIEDIPALLPGISRIIINAAQRNTSALPKLAIIPFNVANTGVNVQEAEVLAQILAVEIANTGNYAVLPRTSSIQAAMQEQNFQMSGYTDDEGAKSLGRAINAQYVLNAEVRSLGRMNLFTAQIIHVEFGSMLDGASREYRTVADGITQIPKIVLDLTDPAGKKKRDRKELSHFWSIGASAGTSLADPWIIGTVRGTIAPLPFSFLELGFDAGFVSNNEYATGYYSLYPFAHYVFFMPLPAKGNTFKGGVYIGAGGGYMLEEYRIDDLSMPGKYFAADAAVGINIGNMLDISYTLRTNFASASNKAAIGYTYRFK